ncbi:unnamed protein product [Sphagnum jensenii]|jgi:hypothetical protein|uniref:Uncharacterized protein n=1 Tax=Sphagnum jensenii TaxID=128206 RepID=A0ABP0XIQ0_9BRYO
MEQQQQQARVGWCIKRGTALAAGPGIMDPESSSLFIGESTNQGQNNPGSVQLTIGSPSINLPVFVSRAFIIRTGARGNMSYHPFGKRAVT